MGLWGLGRRLWRLVVRWLRGQEAWEAGVYGVVGGQLAFSLVELGFMGFGIRLSGLPYS